MGHRRGGKRPAATLPALVVQRGVNSATRGASASSPVAARGPVLRVHPSPGHELRVPVRAQTVVVETAEAMGLDWRRADAASPGRHRNSTGAEGEHQMANPLMAHPVPLADLLHGIPAEVLADHERIPGAAGCFGRPVCPGEEDGPDLQDLDDRGVERGHQTIGQPLSLVRR